MAAAKGGDARKVVLAAPFANFGIAVAKFVAAFLSGSIAMVAEGIHSVADAANQTDGVEEVTQARSLHLGPETILLALEVRFRAGSSVADVERIADALEARIRAEIPPMMKRIFVEADSDYDPSLDPRWTAE